MEPFCSSLQAIILALYLAWGRKTVLSVIKVTQGGREVGPIDPNRVPIFSYLL